MTTSFLAPVCGVKLLWRGAALLARALIVAGQAPTPEIFCPNAPFALGSEFEKLYILSGEMRSCSRAAAGELEEGDEARCRLFVGDECGCCSRPCGVLLCFERSSEMVLCCGASSPSGSCGSESFLLPIDLRLPLCSVALECCIDLLLCHDGDWTMGYSGVDRSRERPWLFRSWQSTVCCRRLRGGAREGSDGEERTMPSRAAGGEESDETGSQTPAEIR